MIANTHVYTVDLDNPAYETRWETPLTYGDKNADIIVLTLTRGGSPATLSTPTAILYGVNADGLTAFKTATVADNVVTATMDETFYAVPGKLDLLLQVSEGTSVVHTPLRISASVKAGITDVLVSTGEELSLAELVQIVADAETATTAANNAADAALEAAQQTVGALNITNLVTNSDFVNTDGWSALTASLSVENNELIITGTGSTLNTARQSGRFTPGSTDIFYQFGMLKLESAGCTNGRIGGNMATNKYAEVINPVVGRWYFVSYVGTNPVDEYFYLRQYYGTTGSGRVMRAKNVGCYNLSQPLGAGNVPSASVMDFLMSAWPNNWFAGTANVGQADKMYLTALKLKTDINDCAILGVLSGLLVTAQGTPDMSVAISAGICYGKNGRRFSVSAVATQDITAANATLPRRDIIYVDSYGVTAYLAGTASATPAAPSVPTGGMLVANISVPAAVTAITTSMITNSPRGTGTSRIEAAEATIALIARALTTENQAWRN